MKICRAVYRSFYPIWLLGVLVAAILTQPAAGLAQEKKNVRMVFVSLAWNSEIPFRVALARGFFKSQGIQIDRRCRAFDEERLLGDHKYERIVGYSAKPHRHS